MVLELYYKQPGLNAEVCQSLQKKLQKYIEVKLNSVETEICYYIESTQGVSDNEREIIHWIISEPFEEKNVSTQTVFESNSNIIEIGPRLNFSTAFSTNVVSMLHSVGIADVNRIEFSIRYVIKVDRSGVEENLNLEEESTILDHLHDKMTHCRYHCPLQTFELDIVQEEVYEVDILQKGKTALEKANKDLGLAFDDWDVGYYSDLFREKVKRNPTSVECFDLAQSNSEHSRHWFFKGRMVIDGEEKPHSLFKMVMDTQSHSNDNNIIKFNDNSSAIQGFKTNTLCPSKLDEASPFLQAEEKADRHIIFTAETHNFPTGVAPFPGATTGTGGRIRDVQATGRGAHVIAGTAGYSFGNLNIPGYDLPWEDGSFKYPPNFAKPVDIAIEASNGASDYGNKFGEPVLAGFARSFGLLLHNGERREWVKPIMFSGGIGSMEDVHTNKMTPEKGMEIVKIGGPVYRIGVGGGAASSIQVQGDNDSILDLGAVQRGDAEMEQKMNRLLRGCVELRENNPICSIHDQGAGGNGNVLKEICEPCGAIIHAGNFTLGDPTLSIMEIWGAEYQESNAILIQPEDKCKLLKIGKRENCPIDFVGKITDTGKIQLVNDLHMNMEGEPPMKKENLTHPVDLDLELVLGQMPQKTFDLHHKKTELTPLHLPNNLTVREALKRVLRLPSVASKRYLTNKVDRAVTGLVAQQQCVGPLHTPVADVAVVALSYFDTVGAATAIGEQPIKGLVNVKRGARMTVGEALTNLVCAQVTALKDVKCSGNWMWAAKLEGEGALLYDACESMCEVMSKLGVAVDGGKDSLSMAARVGDDTVKAPGTLVVSTYVGCPDITATLTPDIKFQNNTLLWIRFGSDSTQHRLGGSALAQCYSQIGDNCPDMDSPELFVKAFNITQQLMQDKKLLSAHDVSDGGLLTCVLEMAFAGNCGLVIDFNTTEGDAMSVLFAEELGLVVEVFPTDVDDVCEAYNSQGVYCRKLGQTCDLNTPDKSKVSVTVNGTEVLNDSMAVLRDEWEETSFKLETFQANSQCVLQEMTGMKTRKSPQYHLSFYPADEITRLENLRLESVQSNVPKVAVIREEGSNGDREMVAAFHSAGFEVWDVNMYDLCKSMVHLDMFRGIAFVGGFSYADAMGSAKGWAAAMKFNSGVQAQLKRFYMRENTFSLGVCNGCQLMALLGWVCPDQTADNKLDQGLHLKQNVSERFESRFVNVKIGRSPAIMLKGMEDSLLGIWVQHGEGRFAFKSEELQRKTLSEDLVPLQYVDDLGKPTTLYPHNPNGSPSGIAGVCSKDGRHLAMMPHPERCFKLWQWPWIPNEWVQDPIEVSPWMIMFANAYKWCSS